jgi:hypothetical protein
MTLIIKILTILKRHGFFIWAICILILGLLVTFKLLGDDLSRNAGIAMITIGILAIFYSVYAKKRNFRP